jgi:hypothetical protein
MGAALAALWIAVNVGESHCAFRPADSCYVLLREVRLTGRLERRTYPGPPNYQSIAHGDSAETGFYLVLRRPICSDQSEDWAAQEDVRVVQLILQEAGYRALRPQLGRTITLQGALVPAATGHAHAALLLQPTVSGQSR